MQHYLKFNSIFPLVLAVLLPTQLPAQSLQDFIRDLTGAGLVNNTPITREDSRPPREEKPEYPKSEPQPGPPPQGSGEFITVKQGDTLVSIAERELGDANKWREICAVNQIQDRCNAIVVGQRLELPASVFNYRATVDAKITISNATETLKKENFELQQNLKLAQQQLVNLSNARETLKSSFETQKALLQDALASAEKTKEEHASRIIELEKVNKSLQNKIRELEAKLASNEANETTNADTNNRLINQKSIRADIIITTTEHKSTVGISLDDKFITLRGSDGLPLEPRTWAELSAFIQPDKIVILHQSTTDKMQHLSIFTLTGNFIESRSNLMESNIEAIAMFDLNGDGKIGKERVIEDSGLATLLTDANGEYQVLFENEKFYLLNANRRAQAPTADYQMLHIEPFQQGFLMLYRSKGQLRTHRYTRIGEFQEMYDINTYTDFFTAVSTN